MNNETLMVLKDKNDYFFPRTKRAENFLNKIEEFNKLVEYFSSDEAISIMSNELGLQVGKKYAKCDEEDPNKKMLDYLSPGSISVDYRYSNYFNKEKNGMAYLKAEMVPVKVDGKIGKKNLETYYSDDDWGEAYLKQLPQNFVPKKRREYLSVDSAIEFLTKIDDKDQLQSLMKYHEIEKAFRKYGIKCEFQCIREMPSDAITINRFFMDDKSFKKLYEESAKLYYPCMLHNPEPWKSKAEALIKDGYIERMTITKVKNDIDNYFKSVFKDKTRFEFNFTGNSIMMFYKASISIMTQISSGLSGGSSMDVEISHNIK